MPEDCGARQVGGLAVLGKRGRLESTQKRRDIVTCADCADDGEKYRGIIAAAKSTGTWKEGK